MTYYNSDFRLTIKHYGHPINNWGYLIEDRSGNVVKENRLVSQYNPKEAIEEGSKVFLEISAEK